MHIDGAPGSGGGIVDGNWEGAVEGHIHFFAFKLGLGVSCFSSRTSSGKLSATNMTARDQANPGVMNNMGSTQFSYTAKARRGH